MKMYGHIGRLTALKHVSKKDYPRIRWALKLKPGELVNDCTGFNRFVIEANPELNFFKHDGWYIYDVDFEVSDDKDAKEGGSCSLIHCGVQSALSREACEKHHLDFLNYWMVDSKAGAAYWGGFDNPEFKDQIDCCRKKWELLKNGGHISDEQGVRLPEFRQGL